MTDADRAEAGASRKQVLAVKQELATDLAASCQLCARRCGVNRPAGERGYCGVGWPGRIGAEHLHFGELEHIIPTHSVFFSGCTMRCTYCRKAALSQDPEYGHAFEPRTLAEVVEQRRREGARSLKLLGGTPEPQLPPQIVELLAHLITPLPVAWETTLYVSPGTCDVLDGLVDLLICNVRYGNDECARRLSDAPGYVDAVRESLERVRGRIPLALRHLVLPGHAICCTGPVAALLQGLTPETPLFLLMQYSPFGNPGNDPRLLSPLSEHDRAEALQAARKSKELVEVWKSHA